ncbi:MAG: hypothetical protein F9K40_03140 [Kofleriaceae bacterium]|nr:MAG: hypothetical protein F9K40_03140 [Kofleriaceae bacterium]
MLSNVAATLRAAVIVRTHALVPGQLASDQPLKVDEPSGTADSVTCVPWSYIASHAVPQLMPVGFDVTTPPPEPARDAVSV